MCKLEEPSGWAARNDFISFVYGLTIAIRSNTSFSLIIKANENLCPYSIWEELSSLYILVFLHTASTCHFRDTRTHSSF
jgi:hypothetical protein